MIKRVDVIRDGGTKSITYDDGNYTNYYKITINEIL